MLVDPNSSMEVELSWIEQERHKYKLCKGKSPPRPHKITSIALFYLCFACSLHFLIARHKTQRDWDYSTCAFCHTGNAKLIVRVTLTLDIVFSRNRGSLLAATILHNTSLGSNNTLWVGKMEEEANDALSSPLLHQHKEASNIKDSSHEWRANGTLMHT